MTTHLTNLSTHQTINRVGLAGVKRTIRALLFACRVPGATRRLWTRRPYPWSTEQCTGPPATYPHHQHTGRPTVEASEEATTRGPWRPQTCHKSNTCRCNARRQTCEWTSSSTDLSTAWSSRKVGPRRLVCPISVMRQECPSKKMS